jgi:hypothetical protein
MRYKYTDEDKKTLNKIAELTPYEAVRRPAIVAFAKEKGLEFHPVYVQVQKRRREVEDGKKTVKTVKTPTLKTSSKPVKNIIFSIEIKDKKITIDAEAIESFYILKDGSLQIDLK